MRLATAIALCLYMSGPANACRLALAIALDVSGSVDETEYRQQMDGLATALSDADVAAAVFAMPSAPVAVAVFEWSSSDYQRLIQNWVTLSDPATLQALADRLRGWQRAPAPEATGLGAALQYGKRLIDQAPECWKGTLDVSGDGKNNDWPTPRDLKTRGALTGIGINALVITTPGSDFLPPEAGELIAYFQALVVQGPDAFVEVATGFEDYADAMRRKLLKELATRPLGGLQSPGDAAVMWQ